VTEEQRVWAERSLVARAAEGMNARRLRQAAHRMVDDRRFTMRILPSGDVRFTRRRP
jgi:hypothetical protein